MEANLFSHCPLIHKLSTLKLSIFVALSLDTFYHLIIDEEEGKYMPPINNTHTVDWTRK